MTPNAQHKRAERERRKAAGEVRVEVWLSPQSVEYLEYVMDCLECPDMATGLRKALTYSRMNL